MNSNRNSILVEEAKVLSQAAHPGDQYIMRFKAPQIAARAQPGSFVHVSCDPALPMRRPMSVMRVDAKIGWIDVLYKVVGDGTRLLARQQAGDLLSIMGPIGRPFELHPERPRPLLIGGGVGMPPMIFVADALRNDDRADWRPLVVLGSEVPFPFRSRPSAIMVPGMPDGVIAAMPQLEDWGVPSRLASLSGFPGCYEGYAPDLARVWLASLDDAALSEIEIFACGPTPMLKATAHLAQEYDLPCQVSLEEFMACAVGGCAGCTVLVETASGPAMKRVCVDGPVFEGKTVFPLPPAKG
ncbi:MAG TPA: dihydroorotate dehydrogenase electron transfer subunit [Gammaproteobacteria bacterium]|nr:dihydroorotate dehydrogenase electron transfer subunit [Gammaproteobacteria bacterium]